MDRAGFSDWVGGNGNRMSTFDFNAPLDELEPLRDIIGDAKVVAIGESAHHVREYFQIRHRMLRFLVERCGFNVLALEAPFTEGHALEDWVAGGPGTVQEASDAGIALSLGNCHEMYEALTWIRRRNSGADHPPVRCTGTDLPGSCGSALPALVEVKRYLSWADPEALPLIDQAIKINAQFDRPDAYQVLAAYPQVPGHQRDALSAALGQLKVRMARNADHQLANGHGDVHESMSHHLLGAWSVDHMHRSNAVEGFEAASTYRDAYMAVSIQRLLKTLPSHSRIVFAAHNWHIKRTPDPADGTVPLLPAGYHLGQALGDDYRAIGLTGGYGRVPIAGSDPEFPDRLAFVDAPLPAPSEHSIEAAFPCDTPWLLADLRTAASAVGDTASFDKMRMSDYFLNDNAFDAFDAIAHATTTTGNEQVLPAP